MWNIIVGIVMVLHGLVHLLYAGQSRRAFQLVPGMSWPDGSWVFSATLGNSRTRVVATVLLVVAALALMASGIGLLTKQTWAGTAVVAAAVFSTLTFLVLWDGSLEGLASKGAVGVLINVLILVAVLVFHLPRR